MLLCYPCTALDGERAPRIGQQAMHTPESVFVTDGFPEHTYVSQDEGAKEVELKDGLEQRNKIISISGPSKSGKTTLCDQVFGTSKGADRIYVTGETLHTPDDLWKEAFGQVSDDTQKPFEGLSFGQRLEVIVGSHIPLIIDDYHYIKSDLQSTVAKQIKNAASQGLRIVCLSVPHRGDDPIRNNNDLSGRFFSVNFDYWSDDDLLQIPAKGFPMVGLPMHESFNRALASQALRSPQIMQTLCLEACRIHGKDRPLELVTPNVGQTPEIIKRTIRSYNYATNFAILKAGPARRGKERTVFKTRAGRNVDVYECLLAAFRLNPPFLQLTLDEIRSRVRDILGPSKEPNVRSALQQYPELFGGKAPPLDWDDEKRQLTVVDPHFYFFLRNEESMTSTGL